MKKVTQLAVGLVLASVAAVAPTTALAEMSYNIGYASEYYFRGILQKNSSASAGADFESGGVYVGVWTADVGDGLEVDVYGGYGMDFGEVSVSAGVTGYYYTGQFDDKYEEVNLSVGYGMFSLGYSVGEAGYSSASSDYDFLSLTVETESGIYGTFGQHGQDADGAYIEVGYGTTISEIDYGIYYVITDDDLGALNGETDSLGVGKESEALIFTIGKSF